MPKYIERNCEKLEDRYGENLSKYEFYKALLKEDTLNDIIEYYPHGFLRGLNYSVKYLLQGLANLVMAIIGITASCVFVFIAPLYFVADDYSTMRNAWDAYSEYKEDKYE